MVSLVVFLASAAVVLVAGSALARAGDAIGEASGIGRVWIGSVLLAAATSLPEALTCLAAVRMGVPDLAAGDLFGAGLANMLILALLDLLPPRRQLLRGAALDHALAAALAITLTTLAAILVLVRSPGTILGAGPASYLLLLVYVAGTRVVYRQEVRPGAAQPRLPSLGEESRPSLRRAAVRFAVAALAIVVAAPVLAWSAKGIADATGLGETFVGTALVGLSTTLPELVTSFAAFRMGAFDLAVGNLFGSCAFNMSLFPLLDLAQPGPALFAVVEPAHALTALFAVLLMGMGLAAIVYRAERRFAMIEPDSVLIIVTYALALWVLYARAAG